MGPLEVFLVFLKASALGLGGFGSLPLLREDLILTGQVTDEQLVQALAVGRLSTGPNGTFVVSLGYFAGGIAGAAAALIAACIPPLVMVPLVAFARGRLLSAGFAGFVRGTSLATAGLLLAIGLALLAPQGIAGMAAWQLPLAAVAGVATYRGRIHPALLIALGAVSGLAFARP